MMLENSVATIISLSCPLILMVIGETISERVGVINLSMEGSVMLAAMLGFAVSVITGNVLLGFICALLCGSTISAIIALFDVKFGMNQIVVGFILSMICINLSNFLGQSYVNIPGPRIPSINFGIMNEIPFLGKIIFSQNILVIFSFLSIFISWFFLFRTSAGLLLRSIGENPEAAKIRGVNVNFYRFLYVTVGGAFIGLGGAAFSLHAKYGWSDSHTANFGWIALAIVIFGGWNPVRASIGALAFGALQIIAMRLQDVFIELAQVLPLIPFPTMIIMLILFNRIGSSTGNWIPSTIKNSIIGLQPSALGRSIKR